MLPGSDGGGRGLAGCLADCTVVVPAAYAVGQSVCKVAPAAYAAARLESTSPSPSSSIAVDRQPGHSMGDAKSRKAIGGTPNTL